MPFRHVAFFIKCRARGCGICSWAAGGRNCSVRNAWILSATVPKKVPRNFRSRQKSREVSEFCLPRPRQLSYWEVLPKSACTRPIFTAPYPNAASHHRCIQKHWILQKKNRRKSDGSWDVPRLSFSQLLDHKRNINVSTLWRSRA